MFVAYLATWALQARKFPLSIFLYSLAVSIKMNVLLFAPGVVVVALKEATAGEVGRGVGAGVLLQLVLGAPFLLSHPTSYVTRAFEVTRVFIFKWSVNWQFLPHPWFVSSRFALLLMFLHLRLLWSFAQLRWYDFIFCFFNASLSLTNIQKHAYAGLQQRVGCGMQSLFSSNERRPREHSPTIVSCASSFYLIS